MAEYLYSLLRFVIMSDIGLKNNEYIAYQHECFYNSCSS